MSNSGKKPTADDEVEQLLQAAQDDMLLKLTINSHIARASDINPDLDRRFLALKEPQNPTNSTRRSKIENKVDGKAEDDDDDLCARFAALKNSLPSQSGKEKKSDKKSDESEEDDDDEVEKVIKWAIDAARLDPSPPSDDDSPPSDDDSQDEDDHHEVNQGKKRGKKRK